MSGVGKTVVPIAADTSHCIPLAFSYSEKVFSFLYLKLAPNNEIKSKGSHACVWADNSRGQ